jgi:hypothetical protein
MTLQSMMTLFWTGWIVLGVAATGMGGLFGFALWLSSSFLGCCIGLIYHIGVKEGAWKSD